MKKEINRTLGNSLRCILPSFWWKRLLGKMADRIESAESSASSAMTMATLAGREASDKQDRLVSGSNIKTICGNSILGSGNITPDPSMKVYIPMGGTLSSYSKSDNQSFYRRVRDGGNWVNSWRAIAVTASANKEVVLLGVSYNTTQGCRILISGFQEEDITDKYECVLLEDGSVSSVTKAEGESGGSSITVDSEVSETSENPVQNKVIKAYVDEKVANAGGGSSVDVDTELSNTSTNPVQNKVVTAAINAKADDTRVDVIIERLDDIVSEMGDFATESQLNNKQDVISDLATIRQGAAKGATALQSIPSEYVTENELSAKNYATTSQVNDKQDKIDDLETIRRGAAKGATALQSEQYKGTVTGVKINGTTKNPSSGVVDLGTVITAHQDISGKQDNLVSGTNIKTINGQSILGEGNIEIKTEVDTSSFATREELTSLQDEIIANEEVYAAAANDLLARASDNEERISSEIDARETLQEEFQMLKTSIIENEEVIAATLNDIEGRFGYWSDTYATKKEAKDGVQEVTNAMLENEEVIAAALANLNEQIATLRTQVESLISTE